MVGDRWRDVAAGQAAGCANFFIDYGYRQKRPEAALYRGKIAGRSREPDLEGFPQRNKD